jgi:septal ring factor EnvC (AmiA/AmiB activator)
LEVANKNLDQQARVTSEALRDLETRIGETERQLAAAQGDRDILMRELQRLQTEKAELERRFNDLVVLRDQMQRLQEDLAADAERDALRLKLNRKRHLKGAELLMRGFDQVDSGDSSSVDMEVEIRRDGSSRIDNGDRP